MKNIILIPLSFCFFGCVSINKSNLEGARNPSSQQCAPVTYLATKNKVNAETAFKRIFENSEYRSLKFEVNDLVQRSDGSIEVLAQPEYLVTYLLCK
jgi:hypothetical protein